MSEDLVYTQLLSDIETLKRECHWLAEKLAKWCKKDMYTFCPVDECRLRESCFENTVDYILKMAKEVTCQKI